MTQSIPGLQLVAPKRFDEIFARYKDLTIAVIGDISLDRYLEIDPDIKETSIETGLDVFNVTHVRSQPGSAGTIINNLSALGIGRILPVSFAGEDGEGFELARALKSVEAVDLQHFFFTESRRTFTYTKPLVLPKEGPPHELNRLDFKNRLPTPVAVEDQIIEGARNVINKVDAVMLMDQVEVSGSGVLTRRVLSEIEPLICDANKWILADSRHGLGHFPSCAFKMNHHELGLLMGKNAMSDPLAIGNAATDLARKNHKSVFVTMADQGMLCATPVGQAHHMPGFPIRPPIDIVGAGDSVSANLIAALAAGASEVEAIQFAMAAASVVIHMLGTTGTASPANIAARLYQEERNLS